MPLLGLHVSRVGHVLSELCNSYEWAALDTSLAYRHACERQLAQHFDQIVTSWREMLFPTATDKKGADKHANNAPLHLVYDRSLVLEQKWALCATAAPLGMGVCEEPQLSVLNFGAAVGLGACESCRTFVADAVAVLRRSGYLALPYEGAVHKRMTHQIEGVCDDIAMRHNTSGVAYTELHEQCTLLKSRHLEDLYNLAGSWSRADLVDHMCADTLMVCDREHVDVSRYRDEL